MTDIFKNLPTSKKALQGEILNYKKQKKAEELCPRCRTGRLTIRKGRRGFFLGCDRWPECKYTRNIKL